MAITTVPLPVRGILKKLGEDIANARKRRRIATATMAQRANISRPTLLRLEHGDAGVSLGIFATVLFNPPAQGRFNSSAQLTQNRTTLTRRQFLTKVVNTSGRSDLDPSMMLRASSIP